MSNVVKQKDQSQREGHADVESMSNFQEEQIQHIENNVKQEELDKSSKWFVPIFIFYLIQFIFSPAFGLLSSLGYMLVEIQARRLTYALSILWIFICNAANVFAIIAFFFFHFEDKSILDFFYDGLSFQFTCLLVFTYLKMNHHKIQHKCLVHDNVVVLTTSYFKNDDMRFIAYYFDYEDDRIMKFENQLSSSNLSKYFQFLSLKQQNSRFISSVELLKVFNYVMFANMKQHLILLSLIAIKLAFCFRYIYLMQNGFKNQEIVYLVVILLIYFYNALNLNRILGNYDLRRKTETMNYFKSIVDFSNIDEQTHEKKLDVTCPRSIEAWEYARKVLLSTQKGYLENIELSYLCFTFYYFFVIAICMSAYFDLYWIIPEKSVFLDPFIVIMNSFTFIILSSFLLFRIQYGNGYNDSFDTLEEAVVTLIDVFKDLQSMYDEFFTPEKQLEQEKLYYDYENQPNQIEKEKRYSAYGLFIKKIKLKSRHYIQNQKSYQGKVYTMKELSTLRLDMLLNIQKCLIKSKEQINSDSSEFKYRFLNMIDINFYDAFTTIAFTLITSLPTIVPKMEGFYKMKKE